MLFEKIEIQNSYLLKPEKRVDERGFFAWIYCKEEFKNKNIEFNVSQMNTSSFKEKGTLGDFIFKKKPYEEAKLLKSTHESIYDVMFDLRPESSSYLKWVDIELTEENGWIIYVPKGCSHGFLSLEDNTMVSYMVDTPYHPNMEAEIRFDEPFFKIEWPIPVLRISNKDLSIPDFNPDLV